MLIVTQNSTYEFSKDENKYRKLLPEVGEWKTYEGFLMPPTPGKSLRIVRNTTTLTTTTKIISIMEDETDDDE